MVGIKDKACKKEMDDLKGVVNRVYERQKRNTATLQIVLITLIAANAAWLLWLVAHLGDH